ncbi:MAG TPA: LssY C-terminal domain-containing protein [Caulobacteraceae bacterium]
MPGPIRRRHLIALGGLALAALAVCVYAALPIAWEHHEHHKGFAGRPMVTRTKQGIPGDPINFGLVGSPADIVCAFTAAGWQAANPVTMRTSLAIVGSVALRRPYPAAPVSPLFYQGRREDMAFERAEGMSAARRHHVRLWRLADGASDPAMPRWLGSDSFDRGVGFSHYTWRVTHHIDPDLDGERDALAAALAATGHVADEFEVSGVGPTVAGRNGGGDPYFTDGEVEIERLNPGCGAAPTTPTHETSPWPVRLRTLVWRLARPVNRLLRGEPATTTAGR